MTDNPVGAAALVEAQGVVYAREGKGEQAIRPLRQAVEGTDLAGIVNALNITSPSALTSVS